MSMFESTFTLLAAAKVGFGPRDMGVTFAILGVFAVIVQGGLIGKLVKRFGEAKLVNTGALLCAVGLLLIIVSAEEKTIIFLVSSTAIFMVGNSLMVPTSSSLVTKRSTQGQGASLGFFQSFASLGRILGPITGGAFFVLDMGLPYVIGSVLLLLAVLTAGSKISVNAPASLVQD